MRKARCRPPWRRVQNWPGQPTQRRFPPCAVRGLLSQTPDASRSNSAFEDTMTGLGRPRMHFPAAQIFVGVFRPWGWTMVYPTWDYRIVFFLGRASPIAQSVKNPPVVQETPVRFLGWENPLEKGRLPTPVFLGCPCGSAGGESACNVGDLGSIPGWGSSPREAKGYPLQYSGLENPMD